MKTSSISGTPREPYNARDSNPSTPKVRPQDESKSAAPSAGNSDQRRASGVDRAKQERLAFNSNAFNIQPFATTNRDQLLKSHSFRGHHVKAAGSPRGGSKGDRGSSDSDSDIDPDNHTLGDSSNNGPWGSVSQTSSGSADQDAFLTHYDEDTGRSDHNGDAQSIDAIAPAPAVQQDRDPKRGEAPAYSSKNPEPLGQERIKEGALYGADGHLVANNQRFLQFDSKSGPKYIRLIGNSTDRAFPSGDALLPRGDGGFNLTSNPQHVIYFGKNNASYTYDEQSDAPRAHVHNFPREIYRNTHDSNGKVFKNFESFLKSPAPAPC